MDLKEGDLPLLDVENPVYNFFSESGLAGTVNFQMIFFRNLLCGFGENPEILVTSTFVSI